MNDNDPILPADYLTCPNSFQYEFQKEVHINEMYDKDLSLYNYFDSLALRPGFLPMIGIAKQLQ